MAERARGDLLWDGEVGAELRARGPAAQLLAVYLWTTLDPYGVGLVEDPVVEAALAIPPADLPGTWAALAVGAIVQRCGAWVWFPLLTLRTSSPTGVVLPYEDARTAAARRWFCQLAVGMPFRPAIHQQFAAAWGLPELDRIVPVKAKALLPAKASADVLQFELSGQPDPQPLLFPEARVSQRELFEQWWAEYPKHRRVEKIRAFAAWSAIRPVVTLDILEIMLKLLRKQRETPEWLEEGGRFVPYPARYLSRGRWLDEVQRVASVPRADVDNAVALASWLETKKRRMLHE